VGCGTIADAVPFAVDTPLVSVGIPTFNRARSLERALRSVLAQTHSDLEVVVSDNASDDQTQALCGSIADQDPRVRYIRQATNVGPTANFNVLFGELRSPYALVLADDDWLEREYVARCLSVLRAHPGCAAVSGRGRYWRGGSPLGRLGLDMQLEQGEGIRRVHAYCRVVGEGRGENSTFFGVMPTDVLRRATPMPNALGNDILVTARVAFQGYVRTLDDVHINRSVGGTSVSMGSIVQTLALAPYQARVPNLVIAAEVLFDVGWRDDGYAAMSRTSRLAWALRCALAAIDWKSVAWHLTAPAAASLEQRPRGRWAWLAYDRLTRTLGARRA
jgi:glycosyltransferase involved in cell wall biosynthesis